jgi:transcriptional regulator with XRE-family HTH domain
MSEEISGNIAANIRKIRETRSLSQDQLARMSGIPRPTWSNLESGSANPTITLLLKVASVFQISVEELIGPPREECLFVPADKVVVQRRGEVRIRKILPPGQPGAEFDRMELPPGARMAGIPHRSGTKEYLTCESGSIELAVAGEKYMLSAGDVVVFRGDQRHSYANSGRHAAVGFSVVLFSPLPSA